jgi:Tfp pilus assembly PilM family ATPase
VLEERRTGQAPPGLTPDLTAQPSVAVSPPRADLSEPLEILTDEISMCLRYHESIFPERRVDRAIFIGGEARHIGLCQHIARTLRLPAQVADPMAGIARTGSEPTAGVDFRQGQPGWALALGLCLSPTDL